MRKFSLHFPFLSSQTKRRGRRRKSEATDTVKTHSMFKVILQYEDILKDFPCNTTWHSIRAILDICVARFGSLVIGSHFNLTNYIME